MPGSAIHFGQQKLLLAEMNSCTIFPRIASLILDPAAWFPMSGILLLHNPSRLKFCASLCQRHRTVVNFIPKERDCLNIAVTTLILVDS